MSRLRPADKAQLEKWLSQRLTFELIYSASRDGCSASKFHEKCDNKSPTISVAYSKDGYVFGGYASQPWGSAGNWLADGKSFLFCLSASGNNSFERLNAINPHVFCNSSYGPCFGHPSIEEMRFFSGTPAGAKGSYGLDMTIKPSSNGYRWGELNKASMAGNCADYADVEVYMLKECKLLPDNSPWRDVSIGWGEKALKTLKEDVCTYKPPDCLNIPHVNLLLVGQVSSGKSSFMNTINSVFRGYVTSRATAGSAEHSLTTMYRMYEIRDHRGSGKSMAFRLCDTMGLEEGQNVDTLGFPYLLDGYVHDRYQFNATAPITPHTAGFRASPSLADRAHVVAIVVDGSSIGVMPSGLLDKVRTIRMHANQRGVPVVVLLTKIDRLDPNVDDQLCTVYHSMALQQGVEQLADKLGILLSHILPLKNYHKETELTTPVDILALTAIRQVLRLADDFFEEQMDLLAAGNNIKVKPFDKTNIL